MTGLLCRNGRNLSLLASLWIVAGGLIPSAHAAVEVDANCLSCHADLAGLLNLSSVHPPFESEECSECHQPHASRHAALLRDEPATLCNGCHDIASSARPTALTHAPVRNGACSECHNPHASANSSLLVEQTPELCAKCHPQVASWSDAAVIHAPVEDSCGNCHAAHEADQPHLLDASPPQLCLQCHDEAEVSGAHPFAGIASSNCSTCHDPHVSSEPNLLRANSHPPFAEKKCSLCHDSKSGAGYAVEGAATVCARCHAESRSFGDFAFRHILDEDNSCLQCHNPHTSNATHLLVSDETQLCTSCHFIDSGVHEDNALTHPEVECGSCHLPHGADNDRYLKENGGTELCTQCHSRESHSSHPVGEKIIDPRNKKPVTCLSCHQLHSAPYDKYLPLDPDRELCIQCHRK